MIYLDTFVFMDILSGEPQLTERAFKYVQEAERSGAVVSAALLAELSFHLRRHKSREKTEEVIFYIKSIPALQIVPVTDEIAKNAGLLRARFRRLKTQKKFTYFDCVHLATAIEYKCSKFVTGDKGFKDVKEIPVEIY